MKEIKSAKEVLKIEAEGILGLIPRLGKGFKHAVDEILACQGRVVVTGIGKSGIVGRKIVATMNSTGTRAFFLHPVEAMHGDLGMVTSDDVALCISNSGETAEITAIIPSFKGLGAKIIAMTGNPNSTLAGSADIVLDTFVAREACPLGLSPTASSTAQLALGDALAVVLIKARGFNVEDFQLWHPGGSLGERLQAPIKDLMIKGKRVPKVKASATVVETLKEMSAKGLGATLVMEGKKLLGIFTDGDLRRRLMEPRDLMAQTAAQVMTPAPRSISIDGSAAGALDMMEKHLITVLPVLGKKGEVKGILHLHDLLGRGDISFKSKAR